jgi:hypothetical protein
MAEKNENNKDSQTGQVTQKIFSACWSLLQALSRLDGKEEFSLVR